MNAEQSHDDEDELSLSDFPLIQNESIEEVSLPPQLEFDFHCSASKQSQMRAADEIFFQGRIKCMNSDYPRSESISSGSSSSSAAAAPRNVFHSYPSPSPRTLSSNERRVFLRNSCVKKSWSWSVFRLGLIAAPPPELGFRDLKTRCSEKSGGGGEKKLKAKAWDLAGGCGNCAVDVAFMRRSASDGEKRRRGDEEGLAAAMTVSKSASSRTFEWLRQLSVHGAAVDER